MDGERIGEGGLTRQACIDQREVAGVGRAWGRRRRPHAASGRMRWPVGGGGARKWTA